MRKCLIVAALLAAVALVPQTASADIISVGDQFTIGSWAQQFNESGVGPFDRMELFFISGPGFEAPGFNGFTVGGWTATGVNAAYFVASGPAVTSINFNILFNGESSTPLLFDFLAWNGASLLERARIEWNPGWNIYLLQGAGDYDRTASSVPEPATLSLLGLGLVGIARAARRNRK